MIRFLNGFPEGVIAAVGEGRVTRADYDEVLIPKVKERLAHPGQIRLYYELGSQFAGIDADAVFEDFKVGMEYLARWERVAVVTDARWIQLALGAFRFLMPGKLRLFDTNHVAEAREWITA